MKYFLKKSISCLILLSWMALFPAKAAEQQINIMNDISHQYSFFFAWKNNNNFGGKYGYVDKENNQQFRASQATISSLDLTHINLFNLILGSKYDLAYTKKDVVFLKKYVQEGGGLFILPTTLIKDSPNTRALLAEFGITIPRHEAVGEVRSKVGTVLTSPKEINILQLDEKYQWQVQASDKKNNPIIATRKEGKGHITVASYSPFKGQQTKGKKIPEGFKFQNYEFIQTLFKETAAGKKVVKRKKKDFRDIPADKIRDLGSFRIRYTDYSADIVEKVLKDYYIIYPILEKFMGVPMVSGSGEGETFTIDLLATGSSGVSTGKVIGISMHKDSFFGILGHELTHSWVLPYGEPLSGEGIAIHIGNKTNYLASKKTNYQIGMEQAKKQLNRRIQGALKHPSFKEWDPVTMKRTDSKKYSKTLTHGKYLYIIREFEKNHGDDIVARYYRLKRKLLPSKDFKFTAHDSVWLWSEATGVDQFGYFQNLGISVERNKVSIPAAKS